MTSIRKLILLGSLAGTPVLLWAQGEGQQLLPLGYGRLDQDNLSVSLRADNMDIRFTVLQENAMRLLNEDSYNSLHGLVGSRQSEIDSIASQYGVNNPGLLFVRYFSLVEGTRFDAQLVTLNLNGVFYLPLGIVPLTPSIQSDRLGRRQQAQGIYVFEVPLTPFLPMGFSYGQNRTDAWGGRIDALERERARVQSRFIEAQKDSSRSP